MSYRLTDEQQKLVVDNMKLVPYIIAKYIGSKFADDEDIISDGYVGLCNAAATFDESAGVKFSTYACTCILQEACKRYRLDRSIKRFAQRTACSLNKPIEGPEGYAGELIDQVADETANTEEEALTNILMEPVREHIPIFLTKEVEGYTFKEIGKMNGVSMQRAKQKYAKELEKAKGILNHAPPNQRPTYKEKRKAQAGKLPYHHACAI